MRSRTSTESVSGHDVRISELEQELDGARARLAELEAERLSLEPGRRAVAGLLAAPRGLAFADRSQDWQITLINPFALGVLRGVGAHLGAGLAQLQTTPLPVLLPFPLFSRETLERPDLLPQWSTYQVGDQWLESYVAPGFDDDGTYLGVFFALMPVTARQAGLAGVAQATADMEVAIGQISSSTEAATSVAAEGVALAQVARGAMDQLRLASREIGATIKEVSSVAQQTNLLALNATIEAARAGASGAGFAVVAREVKDLARSASLAADRIALRVETMRTVVDEAVAGVEAVSGVVSRVDEIQEQIGQYVDCQREITCTLASQSIVALGGKPAPPR